MEFIDPRVQAIILRNIVPMFPPMIFFGLIFGFTGNLAELSLFQVSAMSYIIFAGSAQFIVLLLIINGDPLLAIALTGILINSRHLIYGIAMNAKLKAKGWIRFILAYFLIDESFLAFNLSLPMIEEDTKIEIHKVNLNLAFLLTAIPMWLSWNVMTVLGYLLYEALGEIFALPENFIIASTFIGFAVDQWRNNQQQRWLMITSIIICFIFGFILNNSVLFVFVMVIGIILSMISAKRSMEEELNE